MKNLNSDVSLKEEEKGKSKHQIRNFPKQIKYN